MKSVDLLAFPNLANLIARVLEVWPEHKRYIETSVSGRDEDFLRYSDLLSDIIGRLAATMEGGLERLAADYRFLCEKIVLPEELYFRRTGRYRLDSFEEALRTVYNNTSFMTRYMNGLLLSDVLWVNHCRALQHYFFSYLPSLKSDARLLEIGPGHGLLLYLATRAANVGKLSAWDVSEASLTLSRHALKALDATSPVSFEMKNIFDPSIMQPENAALFDGVVLSEVLEHLERPEDAVKVLFHICRPGGRVWINIPANSPAPDHLFLVTDPRQVEDLVRSIGFEVVDTAHLPMTGVTLERALKQKLTITCVVVGERPLAA